MGLSNDLIQQFVRITNDKSKPKKDDVVYGVVTKVGSDRPTCVQLDGSSETSTPVISSVNAKEGDRVIISLKNHTATVTGNLTSPSTTIYYVDGIKTNAEEATKSAEESAKKIVSFEAVIAGKASLEELYAERARIDILESDNVTVKGKLTAAEGDISDLKADNVAIREQLTTHSADIEELKAGQIIAYEADIKYAKIDDLDSATAKINVLDSDTAAIKTLIFGSATGDTIQTSFANAVIALLGDAQIKSAMIESVSASKVTAGDIVTNNVRVLSEDGRLIISDETLQISDESRVRVQIGKDASNDYSINVWDAEGNLMFSKGGITDSAIKDAIIRDSMVSDTANISAHKLNIDSLFEEINGSTKTIKSSKIYLDDEKQTLDVSFKEMATDVEELGDTVSSQGTAISVMQGQISSKVWQQDINAAKDQFSEETETLSTKYSTLEQSLDGFRTTVSSTYATAEEVGSVQTTANDAAIVASNAETLIKQLADSISMLVTDGNGTSLMTQTEDGWTFSTANIQELVNKISEDLNVLTEGVGSTNDAIDVLKQAVDDLGEIAGYVKIGTYENEPCIELGEGDSEFKLRITNTRMVFTEGSNVLAYFNNQSLHIKKAVVEDELQQGGFVWKVRSNGNMGLTWKGGNS